MNRGHYYNEFDRRAAEWLRQLIAHGVIPPGFVDERDIRLVKATDLVGYDQCHFFAGIGGWPLALFYAGWANTRRCWTASCPCPPFSSAGKSKCCPGCGGKTVIACPVQTGHFICCQCETSYFIDERHLWPEVWRLIVEADALGIGPATIFGEQVASPDGRVWLAGVRGTLERIGRAFGASDLCAAGIGAPQIRQRLFWVGYTDGQGWAGSPAEQWGVSRPIDTAEHGSGRAVQLAGTDGRGLQLAIFPTAQKQSARSGAQRGPRSEQERELPGGLEGCVHAGALGGSQHMRRDAGKCGDGRTEESARSEHRTEPDRPRESGAATMGSSTGRRRTRRGVRGKETVHEGPGSRNSGLGQSDDRSAQPVDRPDDSGPQGHGHDEGQGERESQGRSSSTPGAAGALPDTDGQRRRADFALWRSAGGETDWRLDCWDAFDVIWFSDGKARRIEPGSFPLAHGVSGRVGLLRGYGNAIVSALAAMFIICCEEARKEIETENHRP